MLGLLLEGWFGVGVIIEWLVQYWVVIEYNTIQRRILL